MRPRVRLEGSSSFFKGPFRKTLEDCGFEAVDVAHDPAPDGSKDIFVIEVLAKGELVGLDQPVESRPFLIFTEVELDDGEISALKDKGLMGIVRQDTPQEDIYFLINRAHFYDKVVKRNPRIQVSVPVELTVGQNLITSVSSQLSRDGMFIVSINPLPTGTRGELVFELPGVKMMRTAARVLYGISINRDLNIIANPNDPMRRQVTHPGMAVFFEDLPAEDRDLISGFIRTAK